MILPGMFPAGAFADSAPSGGLTWLGVAAEPANQSSYDFIIPHGDTTVDRRIILAVATRSTSERSITAVEIGGSAATIHVNLNSASSANDTDLVIASRLMSAGETDQIATITCSSTVDICTVSGWRLEGETSSSPHDTVSDIVPSGTTLSAAIDIPETGVIIAAQIAAPTTGAVVWSGIDEEIGGNAVLASMTYSFASRRGMALEAGHIVQGVFTDTLQTNTGLLAAISWQYA